MHDPQVEVLEIPTADDLVALAHCSPRWADVTAERIAVVVAKPATQVVVACVDDRTVGMALLPRLQDLRSELWAGGGGRR